jgi:predicted lipoprotein with Yx(FWY)xxD motif
LPTPIAAATLAVSSIPNQEPLMLSSPFRVALVLAALAAAALPLSAAAASSPTVSGAKPGVELKVKSLGTVVATPTKLGIYYLDTEKKAGGKIKCTGACATSWPPIYVTGTVTKHVTGVMATFGSIARNGKRQLTVNGLPAYTYQGDTAGVVKCDGVDGWHAVRAM